MRAATSLVELIGNTPLVRLDRIGRDVDCHLLAKLELLNPGGSVKDRPALAMITDAEARGLLQPGGTIVEPTSGNTGVGLALVAQKKGYSCVFVCPDKVAKDKIDVLRAYGARVEVCPTAVAPEDPRSRLCLLCWSVLLHDGSGLRLRSPTGAEEDAGARDEQGHPRDPDASQHEGAGADRVALPQTYRPVRCTRVDGRSQHRGATC
ncbi:MAG: pyridoxal-phosphate dependent enzyme, partial [Actinobacteria bacterium]|nr:pyridoxal-phosphate dependent enzyme [Actinomycetota bacterium]